MRFVIPRFEGEDDVFKLFEKLKLVLEEFNANGIRQNKLFGVLTFRLKDENFETWQKFCRELEKIHPNCIAYSYTELDAKTCDRRNE